MIPRLYEPSERLFNHNGIGTLTDATICYVEREINGIYELEMRYPVGGHLYGELHADRIILSSVDPITQPQPFRIYEILEPAMGQITVYARHIAYDCQGITCTPFAAPSAATTMTSMVQEATTECPFAFSTEISNGKEFTSSMPKPIWDILGGTEGSILDTYGGEWEMDRFDMHLRKRLGDDNGVSIRYGKNLTDLRQETSIANTWTGVHPYWRGQDGALVQLPERIVSVAGNWSHVRTKILDLSAEWAEPPTEDQLRTRTEAYIKANDIGKPDVSLKVSFVPLEQTVEYAHLQLLERVMLGDTVHVFFPLLGVDTTARVVSVRWLPLLDRYDWVQIGSVRANLADTIARQEQEIEDKPSISLSKVISQTIAKALLGFSGGAVRLLDTNGDGEPDELYIADHEDPNQAVEVWRFNCLGWAASKDGYGGPYVLGATLKDGILAHAITAGNIVAGFIRSPNGQIEIDLDAGLFRVGRVEDIYKYFHVEAFGMVIGQSDSPARLVLDHNEFRIQLNGSDVIYFDALGRGFVPTLYITAALNLLGINITETDTHINAEYVGPIASLPAPASITPLSTADELVRSGTFSGSIINGKYALRVEWTVEPSAAGGTFVPTIKMYLVQASGWALRIGSRTNGAIINGKSYSWTSPAINKSSGETYLGTVVGDPILYTSDGSVEASVEFNFRATISNVYHDKITASGTIEAVDYSSPRVSALTAARCDADGNAASSGDFIRVAFSAVVSPVNGTNTAVYVAKYRPTSGGSYSTLTLDAYTGQYTVTDGSAIIPAPSTRSWEIVVEAQDNYGSGGRAVSVGAARKVWSWLKASGDIVGGAIGKIAEIAGGMELDWILRPHRGIGMPSYRVSSLDETDAAIEAVYAQLGDNTVGYLYIATNVAVESLGTRNWTVTVYRTSASYGCCTAISYNTNPPAILSRNRMQGAWGAWQ